MQEKKSHRKVFIIGGIATAIMFSFCFAMVPLYNLICKATGINTSIAGSDLVSPAAANVLSKSADLSREITVQFTATNHNGMPWDFYPKVKSVVVHPGEQTKVYFYAKNPTARDMTAQAIPSLTPTESIGHFHKIECFCFNQQTLNHGESKNMVLIFQIDKDIPKNIHVITLAYTLFDAKPNVTRKG
jgi:cytochrome c oxidase assembly protein subunit 11